MPELRSGVRRARASPVVDKKRGVSSPKAAAGKKRSEQLVGKYVKTRAAAATLVKVKQQKNPRRQTKQTKEEKEGLAPPTLVVVSETEERGKETVKEVRMGDSGGLSANKVTGQEEEGNTAPFPDRVLHSLSVFDFVLKF